MAKRKDVELKHMKYQKYLIESSMSRLIERGNGKSFADGQRVT